MIQEVINNELNSDDQQISEFFDDPNKISEINDDIFNEYNNINEKMNISIKKVLILLNYLYI